MKKTITLSILFCLVLSTGISAQSKNSQKESFQATYNAIKASVKSNNFKYVGNYVFNNRQREKLEADSNTLAINKENVSGQLTSLKGVSPSEININGVVNDYSVLFNDEKQTITIDIGTEDYQLSIDIKPNGNAFLSISDGLSKNITQVGKISKG